MPLDAAADSYISPSEKAKLHALFKKENLASILMLSAFGISPDPHHTTAFVQHFRNHKLLPWMAQNFPHAKRQQFIRSDGCTGQFKCGKHFRYISSSTEKGLLPLDHSHSESCHGKDDGDHEGGCVKLLWETREMMHTATAPTQMDTSEEIYNYAIGTDIQPQGNMQPQRTIYEKRGVAVYQRLFFYIGARDVNHNLAECQGAEG